MGYDEKVDRPGGADVGEAARPRAPGKTTKSEKLPGAPRKPTGFALIDNRPKCEQEGHENAPGCNLTKDERRDILLLLHVGLGTAMDNFRDAIQDARIEKLTATEHGWGFLEEFLFYSISGPLVGVATRAAMHVVLRGAARMAETNLDDITLRIAKIEEKTVQGAITNVSRAARSGIKKGRTGIPEGNSGKAVFLQRMREGIKPFVDGMISRGPTEWDDDTLVAIAQGYHNSAEHTVAHYASYINAKLASFDANRMDDVGRKRIEGDGPGFDVPENQRGRLVWVQFKGRRLAMLGGRAGNELVRWIDTDFEDLAANLYRERTGKEPDEMTYEGYRLTLKDGGKAHDAERTWLDDVLGMGAAK
ncbi:MAG: hypothetical protein HS111_21935 [Kofleriaceae bacterium]|nr:hypothetical protein [Kofleriaceae bacterium]MCL4224353.1 hypothetical protein [Myxococcales bacterium]